MMCSSSQNVNLPESHIPSLGEKHHAATGCRTQVYSPLVIIIHLLYQLLQNEPDEKNMWKDWV